MSVRLVYETHATSTDNERGIATGWLPGELSSAGADNARDLGRRRRDDGLDLILTTYAGDRPAPRLYARLGWQCLTNGVFGGTHDLWGLRLR
jgi:broad specificity phosphatase PhoE